MSEKLVASLATTGIEVDARLFLVGSINMVRSCGDGNTDAANCTRLPNCRLADAEQLYY
jgi:hypothetical protein